MAGDEQNVANAIERDNAIKGILSNDASSDTKIGELINLHTSYPDECSKSVIREQTERLFLKLPTEISAQKTRTSVIESLINEGLKNGGNDTKLYQEVGRLCRYINNSDELKQLLNPVKPEQNQTNIEEDQEPNQINIRKLCALSGLTDYLDNDTITSSGKLLDPYELKMTSAMTVLLVAATVASYVLPIPDPLSASLATVAVGKTLEAVYQGVVKQNFSKVTELIGEAIGLGVSAGLVAFGVRFVTPITLGIGISIAGLAACNHIYNSLQDIANNNVYTSSKIFYKAASLPFFIPALVFKGGSYLIQKTAESVKNVAQNLTQFMTKKPNGPTNSPKEQQPLIRKQLSFHEDTHQKSIGVTVVAVKILSGVLGGIRLPFQVAINMMKLSTTARYEGTRIALCEVVHKHQQANPDAKGNSAQPTQVTSFTGLNSLVNGNRDTGAPGLFLEVISQKSKEISQRKSNMTSKSTGQENKLLAMATTSVILHESTNNNNNNNNKNP